MSIPSGSHVLFVSAHPDDEAMFFVPTLNKLTKDCRVHLLCLSTGDYEGLGTIRVEELKSSCRLLGIQAVQIIDHEELRDGPENLWRPQLIVDIIKEHVQKWDIHQIFTFDRDGVSGHPNHCAVHRGVKEYLKQYGGSAGIEGFELHSTNIVRKYVGLLDIIPSYLMARDQVYVVWNMRISWQTMTAHWSQFVWFRRLFVIFSRYSYINTWSKMKPV